MDHVVYVWMRLEDFIKILLSSDVNLKEFGSFSADKFDAVNCFFRGVEEVVCDDNFVVCLEQRKRSEGAYVARPSGIKLVKMMDNPEERPTR